MGWQVKKTIDGLEYYFNNDTHEIDWAKPEVLMSKAELEESKGESVFVPHPTDLWQPAQLLENNDGMCKVKTGDGKVHLMKRGAELKNALTNGRTQKVEMWPVSATSLKVIENDLVMAENVNAGIISYTLRKRYQANELYTWVGAGRSVLVSINPYKSLPLYGDDQINLHFKKTPNKPLPPHPFGIACDSYENMLIEGCNQSILISGESGAGKTEATKQCLKFLASVAGSENNVENKILMANPLLEAYGNAKTIRNNNSSRFGKWIEMHFDPATRAIVGAQILNYLLEKSRVVYQQKGERNYHIFYQMCQDSALSSKFELSAGAGSFSFLNQSGVIKASDVDDEGDLGEVRAAMDALGFTSEEKEWCFRTAAAVLHLGNVEFKENKQEGNVMGSSVKDDKPMVIAANFLGVDKSNLEHVICFRSIAVRSEKNTIPLDPATARAGLDALAKQVYGKMFDYLVMRINKSLQGAHGKLMGILDIFGFEIFENNSFEQLCINFANEKLQQQFNRTTFKEEEALYTSEGILFKHVDFIDNQEVLDLIEKKPIGILLMLDEECLVPEGSNAKFINKIESQNARHKKFQTDKHRKINNSLAFEIEHYAGVVNYDSSQFMEKNKDLLFQDMYDVCASSKDNRTAALFPEQTNRQKKSLSYQFCGQLNDLMNVLNETNSRYIRCVKPNNVQRPDRFEAPLVVEQLRYSGVFEAVEIRKQGYPFRLTHREFHFRYRCINPGHTYAAQLSDDEAMCREIMNVAKHDFSDAQIGNTRVLYRAGEHKILSLLRNLALETIVPVCQSALRGGLHREYARRLRKATDQIAEALKVSCDIDLIDEAIAAVVTHMGTMFGPFPDAKPPNLEKAKKARAELAIWKELEAQFARLTMVKDPSEKELQELEQAVSKASDLQHIPLTKEQKELFSLARHQVIYMQIKLNEQELDQNGDKYDQLACYGKLRNPKDFAKKKLFGRAKVEKSMCLWTKAKIPTTLTMVTEKEDDKKAIASHAALLRYMGDKKCPHPNEAGANFVAVGVENPVLRDELYAQIIKQTTQNPNPDSEAKAWDLLCVCISSFVPTDDFRNFLLMHFRKASNGLAQQYTSAYHTTKYDKKPANGPQPQALDSMIQKFKASKERSRYSTIPDK